MADPAQYDPREVHPVKRITFLNHKNVAIVLQDRNGPCPLLAITNAFLLLRWIKLESKYSFVHDSFMIEKIRQFIQRANSNPKNVPAEQRANMDMLINDVLRLLPSLSNGLDVNLNFKDVESFEFQPALSVFDLSGLRLLHGFVCDPETEPEVAAALGVIGRGLPLSYNSAVDLLVTADEKAMMATSAADALEAKRRALAEGQVAVATTTAAATSASAAAHPSHLHHHHHLSRPLRTGSSGGAGSSSSASSSAYAFSPGSLELLQQARSAANSTGGAGGLGESGVGAASGSGPAANAGAGAAPAADSLLLRRGSSNLSGFLGGSRRPAAAAAASEGGGGAEDDGEKSPTCDGPSGEGSLSTAGTAMGSAPLVGVAAPSSSSSSSHSSARAIEGREDESKEDSYNHQSSQTNNDSNSSGIGQSSDAVSAPVPPAALVAALAFDGDEAKEEAEVKRLAEEAKEAQVKATVINDWLNANSTQLTFAGLQQMLGRMVDTEVAVLYRNGHFSTIFRKGQQLYSLATDEGFADLAVCWESLDLAAVTGDTQYFFEDFTPARSLADGLDYQPEASTSTSSHDGSAHHPPSSSSSSQQQQQQRAPAPAPAPAPSASTTTTTSAARRHEEGFELPADFDSMPAEEKAMMLEVLRQSMAPPPPPPAPAPLPLPLPAASAHPALYAGPPIGNGNNGNGDGWFNGATENLPPGVIGGATGNVDISIPHPHPHPHPHPQLHSSTSVGIGPSVPPLAPVPVPGQGVSRGNSATEAGTPTASSVNKNDRLAAQAAQLRELTMKREAKLKAQTEADAEMARRLQAQEGGGAAPYYPPQQQPQPQPQRGAPPPSAGGGRGSGGGGKDCVIM